MSKLSAPLKALINTPAARPGTTPAPRHIKAAYEKIEREAASNNVGRPAWLALSTAATMTMNSPESLAALYQVATKVQESTQGVATAELMREVGLKCISFNGIPRTINCLGAFRGTLPPSIASSLSRNPSRIPNPQNITTIRDRGRSLWNSIYRPYESKLVDKLSESHPDLPVHILNSHYGALLADPVDRPGGAKVGRVLSSVVAVACLRAQTGVGPQVTSHLFGLRKAVEDGSWVDDEAGPEQGVRWLASDEGNVWILEKVDGIVEAIGGGKGSSYAPARESKL
ncbi:hypothetical protein W97_06229 [Coniosporium apollinis CBS 100218]|uniref:Dol-P-Man:Man(5)GlcNAc(2)-PP-Dol alpha-1,3-mannosyltransferase n=1 Tax=Coniosporium apollinis (strain CBS 100218) TaxID=1168221 RepID=R7YY44_CONA1|nr:uncharacterized protein W97_06229 [Coniosporium apollinis CBS 100218]EON66827.1 hypothetical protein W97_06229 [Coniosporium apollinis CBS 100218]